MIFFRYYHADSKLSYFATITHKSNWINPITVEIIFVYRREWACKGRLIDYEYLPKSEWML